MTRLAVIAGQGGLPRAVVAALPVPPLVCAMDGFAPAGLLVDMVFRVERLMPFLRQLREAGITQVVFAGAVTRPTLDPALFDPMTAQVVPDLLVAMAQGDDATLRAVIAMFEAEGLQVVGVADLAPGLLAGDGVLGAAAPGAVDLADAVRGRAILDALAPVDVGQACVVARGLCLGIEAIFGTDALLADVAARRSGRGGVFVKRAKIGQDMRIDLPTIGPDTVQAAVAAGLSGLCVQARSVIVLDRARVIDLADRAGLAIWGGA
jgi:DUF1009 family protein